MAIIKIGGDAEANTGLFILPVAANPAGIFFCNTDQTKLRCNFAKNKLSASVQKTLSPTSSYTAMSIDTGYVQTDIAETSDMTVFAIYEHPSTFTSSGSMIASTYRGDATSFGSGLHANSSGLNFIATQKQANGTNTAGGRIVPASGWTLAVGRVDKNTNYVKNLTTGTINTATYSERILGNAPAKIRIGASYDPAFKDSVKIMAIVVFDKALSDSEVDSVANVLRRYAAKHNVTI